MKVALVSFYVMDSTAPLAKHLFQAGVDVDLYSILPHGNQNSFVFSFLENKQRIGFVDPEISRSVMGERLHDYFSDVNLKIFIYPDDRISEFFFLNFFYAYKLARYIKKRKYDIVHILHDTEKFWNLLYLLTEKKKIVQTLHEVTSHETITPKDRISRMTSLVKNSTPIIFNSNVSKERFMDFRKLITHKNANEGNLEMIRFGLYETYYCFSDKLVKTNLMDKIKILNFGRIVPYKGIRFLIESIRILQDQYPVHLIIAGEGTPDFDFNGIKSYEFINKLLSNDEIVCLIEECDFVVLPYISSSQSGIPMTVFAFNKPIVASNIGGFKEVIEHMETGILVDNLNVQTLASSIEILLNDNGLRETMSKNIKNKYSEGEFSWNSIAKKTIKFYSNQINKKK